MERVVITILPPNPDDGLLSVVDAMRQVLDTLRLLDRAQLALAVPGKSFDWLLESASTNTPLTITAVAVAEQPNVDISAHAQEIKDVVSKGLTKLIWQGEPSWWMEPADIDSARALLQRNLNGIARTVIDFSPDNKISIDRESAEVGIRAISGFDLLSNEIAGHDAWGEIEGIMSAAGTWWRKPALQIRTAQYGMIWCTVPKDLTERFGDEHRLAEIWSGKSIAVSGKLIYGHGGKLSRIEAVDIKEIEPIAPVDLKSIQDPEFTSGLDPVEYVRRLNDGDLAS